MAASLSTLATRCTATAAATATALGGGVTTADVQQLALMLAVLALRPGDSVPILVLAQSNLLPQ